MAPRARYRPDYKGLGRMLTSQQMQQEMAQRTEQMKGICEGDAPRDSGSYGSSFSVETGIRAGRKPRAESKLINDDPAAAYVEWGTSRTPAARVMGRAAGVADTGGA